MEEAEREVGIGFLFEIRRLGDPLSGKAEKEIGAERQARNISD